MSSTESRLATQERYEKLVYHLIECKTQFERLNFDLLTKPEADALVMSLKPLIELREKLIRRANSLPCQYMPDLERLIIP